MIDAGPVGAALAGVGIGLGALLCAGSMADVSGTWWPGMPIGLACAAVGQATARGVLGGAGGRLDAARPVYADGASLVLPVLAVALPPLSVVALVLCVWLLLRRRRRAAEVRRPAGPALTPSKLVLTVIDGLAPAALERGVADGRAPTLAALLDRGVYIDDCIAAFPSVTPVCTASIITGRPRRAPRPRHVLVPAQRGALRRLRVQLPGDARSASAGVSRTRSTTSTWRTCRAARRRCSSCSTTTTCAPPLPDVPGPAPARGHRRDGARTAGHRDAVRGGPRELFYADLFASRDRLQVPARAAGARDDHAGCVGAFLVEHDLCDFLLLSLPDNDSHSHRTGPEGQAADSLALADQQLTRVVDARGGLDAFLDDHALIVMADHSHSDISARISLQDGLRDLRVLAPNDPKPEEAQVALCPGWRSAMVYTLRNSPSASCAPPTGGAPIPGVDLVMRRAGDEAVVWSERAALRAGQRRATSMAATGASRASWPRSAGASRTASCARTSYSGPARADWAALHCDNAGEL